jgi:hypothetical protein
MTSGITALAQDVSTDSGGSDAAQANNPLADFRAFNLQNYYIPELSGPIDATANNFVLRYAQPFGKWLMRASLPFARVPTGVSSTESGVGDLDVTATGAGKTQAGVAAVYFDATSQFLQWGGLLTYRTDIAGSGSRPDTSVLAAQPFYFFQLGKGKYLRGAPIWVFDLENDTYHVPVGLGIGQVIPTEKIVFNFFIEPQFTILSKGDGQPEFQLLMAVNMQFR